MGDSTFARLGVALLPVRECQDRWVININIQEFLVAVQKNSRSEILLTAVLALELCTY